MWKRRLFNSVAQMNSFLKLCGIFIDFKIKPEWKLKFVLASFWLILNVVSGLYAVVRFSFGALIHTFISGRGYSQMDELNAIFGHTTPVFFSLLAQMWLMIECRKTIVVFCIKLGPIDRRLARPSFEPLKHYSIYNIVFLAIGMGFHFGFTIVYEMSRIISDWPRIIFKSINALVSVTYTIAPLCIFSLLGQILIVYKMQIVNDLQHLEKKRVAENKKMFKNVVQRLRILRDIDCASRFLHHRFGFILLALCCSSSISIINTSYYLIFSRRNMIAGLWNLFQIALNSAKLFIIFNTSHRIRNSVFICYFQKV